MLSMYREQQGVEQLLTAPELQSLIIATASLWDNCSLSWKAPTGRVLRAISKAQTKNSIMYLQGLFLVTFFLCICEVNSPPEMFILDRFSTRVFQNVMATSK